MRSLACVPVRCQLTCDFVWSEIAWWVGVRCWHIGVRKATVTDKITYRAWKTGCDLQRSVARFSQR